MLQRDEGIWVGIENERSAPLVHCVTPDKHPHEKVRTREPNAIIHRSELTVSDQEHLSA